MLKTVLAGLLLSMQAVAATGLKAGVGRMAITPQKPIYLSGYASRNRPSEGALHDLWAKALAIEDSKGSRVVLVTTDLIGLPRNISETVAARLQKQYGLDRAQLVLNSSHTHTGPVVGRNLDIMFDLTPEDAARIREYAQELTDKLVAVAGAALNDLSPAELSYGHGQAPFAMNRRQPGESGVRIGVNPPGPSDKDVPVLKVTAPGGAVRAIVFGYGCHNTTLTGEFYKVSGDYAGFAQIDVEKAHPGATALFVMLCGGDQNPHPRSKLELAREHGATLAAEVSRVLSRPMKAVGEPVRAAFRIVDLNFAHHTREKFEARLNDSNVFIARHAKAMLETYDRGRPVRRYPYPVQAVALGKQITLVALGGEVVVDYALRVKKEFGSEGMIVAGYSNDVMAYVPSLRVLKEGGYEPVDSTTYYGVPGPWAEDVEERIFTAIRQVLKRVRR